jgi:hypothetical protein
MDYADGGDLTSHIKEAKDAGAGNLLSEDTVLNWFT